MTGFFRAVCVVVVCVPVLLFGCTKKEVGKMQSPSGSNVGALCIGVIQAESVVDYDGTLSYEDAKNLALGVKVMNKLLREELKGNKAVRFALDDKILVGEKPVPGNSLEYFRRVGKEMSCNVVLQTTVNRYKDRDGSKFSAESPASVSFDYRLVEIEKGTVLCRGKFDETQQSVMENLYAFKKARARGFTWVSAEDLMREGLQARFSDCSSFGGK